MSDASLPTGTVTFLLTDVEGSTRLWQAHPGAMGAVIERHDDLAADAARDNGGVLVKSKGEGDSTFSVFRRPTDAINAAIAFMRGLADESWPDGVQISSRVALHTGEAELRHGDYYGNAVNRCARLRAIAHGGQILCTQATEELVADSLRPGVALKDLGPQRLRDFVRPERVFQVVADGLRDDFPPLRSTAQVPTNLPASRSSFVGRSRELEEVQGLVRDERLVTLIGVGGCGKTRLALHTGTQLLDEFGDGVFFCDLALVSEAESIDRVVSQAVRLSGGTSELREDLLTFLGPRKALLILDNCEHLVDPCADLADAILAQCPDMKLLATSREGLRVEGERAYSVPPLGLASGSDAAGSEAVRLFADRAAAERPSFNVSEHLEAVVEICERLDGVPLAIELAAARVSHLTPQQIRDRLVDRFQLLTGGRRRVQRQQTLAAALDWSYDLLSEAEQRFLQRLAVFAGGFTLEAAEGICTEDGDPSALDLLASLVSKSLVDTETSEVGVRYRLLETVRLYVEQKLLGTGEAATFRARHRDWFLKWAESFPESTILDMPVMAAQNAEISNFRAAIEWSSGEDRPDLTARLVSAIYPVMDGYPHEARAWFELGRAGFDDLDRRQQVRWLFMRGWNAFTTIDLDALLLLRRAIELGGDEDWPSVAGAISLEALAHSYRALIYRTAGGDASAIAEETIALSREADRRVARTGLAMAWPTAGVYMNLDMLEDVLAVADQMRGGMANKIQIIALEAFTAVAAHLLGRHDEALAASDRGYATVDEDFLTMYSTSEYVYPFVVTPRAVALASVGRSGEARATIRDALPDFDKIRLPLILNSIVIGAAVVCALEGDWPRAAMLHGATRAAGALFRDPTGFALFRHYDTRIKDNLAADAYAHWTAEGQRTTLPEALAIGLSEEPPVSVSR